MVLKKRLNYEFNGYRLPFIPRAPRSVRWKGSHKKTLEDGQICAFELLATVAGKLLLESESSASSNAEGKDQCSCHRDRIKQEDCKAGRPECLDQASCIESGSVFEHTSRKGNPELILRELPNAECDSVLESKNTSIILHADCSKKGGSDVKLKILGSQIGVGKYYGDVERGSPHHVELCDGKIDDVIKKELNSEVNSKADLTATNTCSSKDILGVSVSNYPLVNSNNSVQLPAYLDSVPNACSLKHRNNVKVGCRDDDENSVECNGHGTKIRAFRPQLHFGRRRIRKLFTSKYWKVAPKLKDCEFSKTNGGLKPISTNWNARPINARIQCEDPSRKRKFYDHNSTVGYEREGSSESISNSPRKSMKGDKNGSPMKLHRAHGQSSPVRGHQASFQNKDSHVKFGIKFFKVPDLYIEVPETATVGSLKRKVMEAVTAIVRDGLHVGVLLQGKKVRDDNRTLLQSGICRNGNLDTVGFSLEPLSAIEPPPVLPKDPPVLIPNEAHDQVARSPPSPVLDLEFSNASFGAPLLTCWDNHVENDHQMVLSPTDELTNGEVPDSKALVAVPSMPTEALSVVPVNQKPRRSEIVQRRTRRPFTVTEVEALVEAVEKLGTGRWRDVKLCAFEDADHRTYVDLKDKWKTLVHTASISPQQRRGEPVPQELLDRVLSAHAYWSQHQSKQHGKQQAAEPQKISEA